MMKKTALTPCRFSVSKMRHEVLIRPRVVDGDGHLVPEIAAPVVELVDAGHDLRRGLGAVGLFPALEDLEARGAMGS